MARRSYAKFGNADYGIWYRFAAVLVKPVTTALVKPDWRGWEHLPKEGGFIAAVNHNSIIDPVIYAHWQYNSGRPPRILGKSSLFSIPFIGFMLRKTGQIPVFRESTDAAQAFRAAIDAVNGGQCVQFYPEGTLTRDPDLWPMTGKSGVARVALMTGAPVIPVAHWGAHEIIPPYGRPGFGKGKFNLFPRHRVTVAAGPAVDLSKYRGQEPHRPGAQRRHRGHHDGDHRRAGRRPRRGAAGRALRHAQGRPEPRRRAAAERRRAKGGNDDEEGGR